MDSPKMDSPKQEQVQKPPAPASTDDAYEWSFIRVAEGVMTNVVSFLIIGLLGIFGGLIYAAALLVLNVLHTPSGLIGILAFILLGAVLMLIILGIAIVAWFRGMSSAALMGMAIGAIVGAAIGAAIDSGEWKKWKFDWAEAATKTQEQKKATKTESE
jgi:hypothetical protein